MASGTTERVSTAAELVAGTRQLLTLSTGARVYIRRVCRVDVLARGAQLLALATPNGKPGAVNKPVDYTDPMTVSHVQDAALEAGMIDPRYWSGDRNEAPNGYVSGDDLGALKDEIFSALMGASGYSEELAAAARFPGAEGTGEGLPAGSEEDGQEPA